MLVYEGAVGGHDCCALGAAVVLIGTGTYYFNQGVDELRMVLRMLLCLLSGFVKPDCNTYFSIHISVAGTILGSLYVRMCCLRDLLAYRLYDRF